jgi:hypothetical protein
MIAPELPASARAHPLVLSEAVRNDRRVMRTLRRGLAIILFAIALLIAVLVMHVATLPVRPANWPSDLDPHWIRFWMPIAALALFWIGFGVAYSGRWLWGGPYSQFNLGRMAFRFYWFTCALGVVIPYLGVLVGLTSLPGWPYVVLIVGAVYAPQRV